MLEQFHVNEKDAVRVPLETLRAAVTAIFEKLNVPSRTPCWLRTCW